MASLMNQNHPCLMSPNRRNLLGALPALSILGACAAPQASAPGAMTQPTLVDGFDRSTPLGAARYFQNCVRNNNLEGALSCFDDNAIYITEPGKFVQGKAAMRPTLARICAMKPNLQAKRSAIFQLGDIASWVDEWTLKATLPDGKTLDLAGVSSDILKKQPGGIWTYLVDNPYGAGYLTT